MSEQMHDPSKDDDFEFDEPFPPLCEECGGYMQNDVWLWFCPECETLDEYNYREHRLRPGDVLGDMGT